MRSARLALLLFATTAVAAESVPDLVARLGTPPAATADQLRALLKSIRADVPNPNGTFAVPPRSEKPLADLDWLDALGKLPASPARDEAMAKVTTLRALAAAKTEKAAEAILDFGFTPAGLVYRDE